MVDQLQDFKMPEKIVTRLLKDSLPEDVILSKDARNAACRSASIFILQLSITAAERAQMNKRRTLDNKDIIEAAGELGLAEYAPQLVRFGAQRKRNARRKETNIQKGKSKRASTSAEAQQGRHHGPADGSLDSNLETSENQDEDMMEQRDDLELNTADHCEATPSHDGEDNYGDE